MTDDTKIEENISNRIGYIMKGTYRIRYVPFIVPGGNPSNDNNRKFLNRFFM